MSLTLKTKQSVLLPHLQLLTSILPSRPVQPILHHIKITPEIGGVTLTATDGQTITLYTQLPLKEFHGNSQYIDEKPVTILATKLNQTLATFSHCRDIQLKFGDLGSKAAETGLLSANENLWKFPVMNGDEFPDTAQILDNSNQSQIKSLSIALVGLDEILSHVDCIAATLEETQGYSLKSIVMELNSVEDSTNKRLDFVTTDGHRLCWASRNLTESEQADNKDPFSAMIPLEGIRALKSIAAQCGSILPVTSQLQIRTNGQLIEFVITNGIDNSFGSVRKIIVRSQSGAFPKWQQIPRSISALGLVTSTRLIMSRPALSNVMKRVLLFTDIKGGSASVVLSIEQENKRVRIFAQNAEADFMSEYLGYLPASEIDTSTLQTQKFSLQAKYLMTVLNVMQSEYLSIELAKPANANSAAWIEFHPHDSETATDPYKNKFHYMQSVAGTRVAYQPVKTKEEIEAERLAEKEQDKIDQADRTSGKEVTKKKKKDNDAVMA